MPGPVVRIEDLRAAVARLLDRVEATHGSEVDLAADYYWVLADASAYDAEPAPPTAGQLSDDVETLREIASRRNDELQVWHDLAHLTAILQRIAVLDRSWSSPLRAAYPPLRVAIVDPFRTPSAALTARLAAGDALRASPATVGCIGQ